MTHLDQGSLFHSPPTLELWLRHSVFWNKISQIDALTVILPNLRCITETLWEANPTYDQFSSSTFIAGQPNMRKSSHAFDGEHCLSQNSSLSSELYSLLLSHWEGKWQIVFYHTAASWVSKDHYLVASTQPSQTDCFQMSYFLHAVSLLQKKLAFQWPSKNKDPRAEDSTEWPWSSGRLCCTQQQRHHIAPRLKEDPIPISYIKWWESRHSSFYTDMILI